MHMSSRNMNISKRTQSIKCLFWGEAVTTPEPFKWRELYKPTPSHSIFHLATSDESPNLI